MNIGFFSTEHCAVVLSLGITGDGLVSFSGKVFYFNEEFPPLKPVF